MASPVPTRKQALENAYNLVLNSIVADLNTKASSRQDISFLDSTSVNTLKAALKGWNIAITTQNAPVTTGSLTSISFHTITFITVS